MSNKTNRESTNSITHLVKIVASEVIDSRIQELREFVAKVARSVCKDELDRMASGTGTIDITDRLDKVRNTAANAGQRWTREEDQLLEREFEVTLEQIAANHSRTVAAIKARVREQQLLYNLGKNHKKTDEPNGSSYSHKYPG